MLRIHSSNSVSSAKSYYTEGLARGDYYGQEAGPGVWFGKAAGLLGLAGEVGRKEFSLLCDNRRPDTRGKLNPRENQNRRVGYDLTFSANKGTSILYSVYRDERVLGVFQNAVRETMELVELNIHTRVRKGGEVSERETGNLVSAIFTHLTSRPVKIGEQNLCDPQLHCHAYTFATTFDSEENRFKSAEFFHIKRDGEFFEAVFHSKLSRGLQSLGYEIINRPRGFEIRGISQKLIDGFSRRTEEIEELAQKLGISGNHKAMDQLGAMTRSKKENLLSKPEMEKEWNERARRIGTDYDWAANPSSKITAEEAVSKAIESRFERQSVVRYRQLVAEALQNAVGSCRLDEIEEAFQKRSDLLTEHRGSTLYTTTKEILQEENDILKILRETKGTHYRINPAYQVPEGSLDDDQRKAVEALMQSNDRVFIIEGRAGTGKTTLMQSAVKAMDSACEKVFCFAPTSDASHNVLRKEGFENSETIQRFLVDEKLQQEAKHCVLWIDEAGLLSTKEMRSLLRVAQRNGNRIVCSGDSRQHCSVGRGDALRLLIKSGLVEVRETRSIYRQRAEKYKLAIESLSRGDQLRGIEILDEMGAIKESNDFAARIEGVANEYIESLAQFKKVLVVSPTHLEGRLVAQKIRELLKEKGILGEKEIEIPTFRNRNLTESEKKLPHLYEVGDVVRFHRSIRREFCRGSTATIKQVNEHSLIVQEAPSTEPQLLTLSKANHFDVGTVTSIPIAKGEKLRLTRNLTDIDGRRLYNGSIHQVKNWTPSGEILLEKGHRIPGSAAAFDYGIVSTSHASQGKTVDKVIVSQGTQSRGAANMEQFYVSASRGRSEISIWIDDKAELINSVEKSSRRMLATEFIPQKEKKKTPRWQEEEVLLHQTRRSRRRAIAKQRQVRP